MELAQAPGEVVGKSSITQASWSPARLSPWLYSCRMRTQHGADPASESLKQTKHFRMETLATVHWQQCKELWQMGAGEEGRSQARTAARFAHTWW